MQWRSATLVSLELDKVRQELEKVNVSKRGSSSSEEAMDTSDEIMDVNNSLVGLNRQPNHTGPMLPVQLAVENSDGLTPGQRMIKEAESTKSRVTPAKGEDSNFNNFLQSAYVDEEYMIIGSHVDETLCRKILNHEYVDFAKLLPRDKVGMEDDQRMELVNHNGVSYWTPMANRELGSISNFSKWETAFRVYSNIYTNKYPKKASELIQYSHVIHTASLTYVWENVYYYDREFHIHMSRHPQQSWSVILQQAWNLRLKDRLRFDSFGDQGRSPKSKEICKRFNKGKCHSGSSCRYDHRCLNCGKFGHGAHICRKKSQQYGSPVKHTDRPAAEGQGANATNASVTHK